MFVGDSLSLNQFESLACMIHSWVPNAKTAFYRDDVLRSLTFQVLVLYPFSPLFITSAIWLSTVKC